MIVVLALVGGAVALILTLTGKDTHSIAIPSTAGGMKRDTAKEAQLKQQLDAAEKQFKAQGKSVSYVKSAVFQQDSTSRGPKGSILFLGAKLSKDQNPSTWIDTSFVKPASSNGLKIAKISAGDGGGKAVCAYLDTGQKGAICAWVLLRHLCAGGQLLVVARYDI